MPLPGTVLLCAAAVALPPKQPNRDEHLTERPTRWPGMLLSEKSQSPNPKADIRSSKSRRTALDGGACLSLTSR